jgi:hypothetical protein
MATKLRSQAPLTALKLYSRMGSTPQLCRQYFDQGIFPIIRLYSVIYRVEDIILTFKSSPQGVDEGRVFPTLSPSEYVFARFYRVAF